MGKLFDEAMRSGKVESLGKEGSEVSRSERRDRREERQAWDRALVSGSALPLRRRESGEEAKVEEQEAVVWVRKSDWERVTEREEFVGRFSFGSRLPQYLSIVIDTHQQVSKVSILQGNITAMPKWVAVSDVLDDSDIHRSCSAGTVHVVIASHCARLEL